MNERATRRLAWGLWAVIPLVMVVSVGVVLLTPFTVADELPGIFIVPILLFAFATVGALVASRRPENAIGWILLGTGVTWAVVGLGDTYAGYATQAGLTGTFLARLADWPNLWFYAPALFLPITLLLLLFPTGTPLSHRWRNVARIAVLGNTALAACIALDPVSTSSDTRFLRSNPFGIAGAHDLILPVNQIAWWLSIGAFLASGVSIVLRFRRSRGY